MNNSIQLQELAEKLKMAGTPVGEAVWQCACFCVGWPYVFGAAGAICNKSNRGARVRPKYPTIKSSCQRLRDENQKDTCSGCKWYPDGKNVRMFDCRGFTRYLLRLFDVALNGAGATSQWNDESNWVAKGTIDTVPDDVLVCLFYTDAKNPKIMAHTGFGFHGETCECSAGVQKFSKRSKKWTHWAIPKGVTEDYVPQKPTLKKGSKGEYVTLLQTSLINLGYKLPKYGPDGSFGNETLEAVKEFQKDHGLTADGIVGKATWEALEAKPSPKPLYTVTIPHLSMEMAQDLLAKYAGIMVPE